MTKKLTLSMDKELITFAHKIAEQTHHSVSGLKQKKSISYSKNVSSLYGLFADVPFPDKKKLRSIFHDKSND